MDWPKSNGISQYNFLSESIKAIFDYSVPKTDVKILDVGCGKGFYGYILRCYFEKRIYLEGVELSVSSKYINILNSIYDKFNNCSILDYNIGLKFDTIFMNHVLEHLNLTDVIILLNKIIENKLCDTLIIGLPIPINRDYIYNDLNSPHTHKWGLYNFPFDDYNFYRIKTNNNRLFLMVYCADKDFLNKKLKNLVKLDNNYFVNRSLNDEI